LKVALYVDDQAEAERFWTERMASRFAASDLRSISPLLADQIRGGKLFYQRDAGSGEHNHV
jgi:hypothetical protein